MRTGTKIFGTIALIALLVFAGWFFFKFYFVFGEGVKAGELNRVVYKGVIFKTYEGRVIQAGFSSNEKSSGVQSNEFLFSVEDEKIANELMYNCSGKNVELHYKEYKGALPWRGHEKFIVDEIVNVTPVNNSPAVIPIETE